MDFQQEKQLYPHVIDYKPGFFVNWFLYLLFKRVEVNNALIQDLRRINREGTIVYAIKYPARFDCLLYHYKFRRSRLPYPKVALDLNMTLFMPLSNLWKLTKYQVLFFLKNRQRPNPYHTGFFKNAIEKGTTSLATLVNPRYFAKQFIHEEKDPFLFLIETQRDINRPIYIVPQLILYKKAPEKARSGLMDIFFGFKENPGFIRKIGLFFRYKRRPFIDFGPPLNLKTYLQARPDEESPSETADKVRKILIEAIDKQKRVILGPIMKSRQQLKEMVLTDPKLKKNIQKMAKGDKREAKRIRKNTEGYFDEIAADYNPAYVELFHSMLSPIWKRLFEGIDVDTTALARIRKSATKGPVVYVPSHKSHMDYLALNWVLHQHHMHTPRIAAGKNLAFWPIGHVFRKTGAFFIRRTFKGARLYARVFTRYIKVLLREGYPIEFFIEGGRSRSGKLIMPQLGFLSILVQAYIEGYCEDLVFAPASIVYDRVPEEKSFLREEKGGKKRQESLGEMLKARGFLKKKYGKIYIRFGQPISLKEFLSKSEETDEDIPQALALSLIGSINRVSLVTPLALVATAILTKHRRGFYVPELINTGKLLKEYLGTYNAPLAPSLKDPEGAIQESLSLLVNSKVVSPIQEADSRGIFYYVNEEKRRRLEFYKNSILHFFIHHSFVALSLLNGSEETKAKEDVIKDYIFLREVFRKEFLWSEPKDPEEEVTQMISYFTKASYITRNNSAYGFTMTKLGFERLPIWASLSKTFLESYWIATRAFIEQEGQSQKRGDLLKRMTYLGNRSYKLGAIEHEEAVSQLTFKNAISFINEGILHNRDRWGDESVRQELIRLSDRLYNLAHY